MFGQQASSDYTEYKSGNLTENIRGGKITCKFCKLERRETKKSR